MWRIWSTFFLLLYFLHPLISFPNLSKLDYFLKDALRKDEGLKTQSFFDLQVADRTIKVRSVKVLRSDGKVEVIDLTKRSLADLMADPDILYIEAPQPVNLVNEIVRDSTFGIWGAFSSTIDISGTSSPYWGYVYGGTASLTTTGNCTCDDFSCWSATSFICDGDTTIDVTSFGDFRVVVGGPSLDLSNISTTDPIYLIGSRSTNTQNKGAGAIVGVVDSGINFCHPMFLNPQTGETRILFYGFYTQDSSLCASLGGIYNSSLSVCEFDSGIINSKIQSGDCFYDLNGHGTHVAGTAAGNDSVYNVIHGIASESDLIIFCAVQDCPQNQQGGLDDTSILTGIQWIKEKAASLNKPAVVNLSLGGHMSPHDGTGTFDRFVDDISGPGFVVVVAAGNDGDRPLHAFTTNTSDSISVGVAGQAWINGWYKNPSKWTVALCDPGSQECIAANPGEDMENFQTVGSTSCSARILNSITESPLNGDGQFLVEIDCTSQEQLELKLVQNCGDVARVDMWLLGQGAFLSHVTIGPYYGYYYTVASPGTAKRAITVGALNSRPFDENQDGSIDSQDDSFKNLGKIAFFSSRGPTRDGRIKPNVSAGGAWVCSANHVCDNFGCYSSNNAPSCDQNNYYVAMPGTSMATPVVSGLVAIYLSLNPSATPEDVKKWLTSNAIKDVSDVTYPNLIYGFGKAIWTSAPGTGGSESDQQVSLQVGSGVGSCQVSPPPGEGGSSGGAGGGGGGCGCAGGYSSLADFLTTILAMILSLIVRRMMGWSGF
jgi:subtilisin family serine protease